MSITRELGQRIRLYRKEKGLSQEQLAELCSLHPTYIGQLERGEKNATIESLYRISKGLNLPLSSFFTGIEDVITDQENTSLAIYRKLQNLSPEYRDELNSIMNQIIALLER